MKHYLRMNEHTLTDDERPPYTGQDILYREKGVSAADVQRAADALLRRGRKPSIAALRDQLGGGSPNTLAPLLEQYWQALGTRIAAGPDALERVPESLARMTEALWLRSIDEARERVKVSMAGTASSDRDKRALEGKVTELTAALAESRARCSELEAQQLTTLRDRLELRQQVQQLTALLRAEQELRAQDRAKTEARRREGEASRIEIVELARRRLATPLRRRVVTESGKPAKRKRAGKPSVKAPATPTDKTMKRGRARLVRGGRR